MSRAVTIVVAAVVVALATSLAAADVLCKRRSGQIVLRTACKRKELHLDLAAIGALGAPGDPGAQGPPAPQLRAVDATGQQVGSYLNPFDSVLYTAESQPLLLNVGSGGFRSGGQLLYEQTGCASPRLVGSSGGLVEFATIFGITAYYAADPITQRMTRSSSIFTTATSCAQINGKYEAGTSICCIDDQSPQMRGVGAAVPVDLSRFVPPFDVEVAP